MSMQLTLVQQISVWVLPIIFAITFHEVAHGYVAYLLGDKTAYNFGRLTLNPAKHIDIVGTIIVPVASYMLGGIIFGWAKPVPVDTNNFSNPRSGFALVSLAGPMANFFMTIIWAAVAKLGIMLVAMDFLWAYGIYYMGVVGIKINLILAMLNLLPIPPLDGWHIVASLLPRDFAAFCYRIEQYGLIILLLLIGSGALGKVIGPAISGLGGLIFNIFNI